VKAGSLFSGVGGLDLAVEAHGFEVAWQVEVDPYCTAVLERHWPATPRHGDIKALDPAVLEPVNLVFGGPPCQPFSTAGKRKVTNDDRWLWPEMARFLRGLRPRYAFVEAPAGLLSPWRDDGRYRPAPVEAILGDLATLGFNAEWVCVRASDAGAPHERARVFILAYAHGGRLGADQRDLRQREPDPDGRGPLADPNGLGALQPAGHRHTERLRTDGGGQALADVAVHGRREGWPECPPRHGHAVAAPGGHPLADADGPRPPRRADGQAAGQGRPAAGHGGELPEPGMGGGPDGLPRGLDGHRWPAPQGAAQYPWEPPRTVIAKSLPNRVQRVTALGNAVVPQQGALALELLWRRMEATA
jgi:DNA (cytosine-5)-methyltransferase 1